MMDRRMLLVAALACFAVAVLAALPVFAQPTPGGDIDPSAVGSQLVDAISSKQWGIVIGAAIMLLVWVIRTFAWQSIPSKALPWLATAIGALVGFATAILANPACWFPAILAGIQAGLAAAGTWGLLKVVRQ